MAFYFPYFLYISLNNCWYCHSWLEDGANNARIVGLIPKWTIHLRVGLVCPFGSLPAQNILNL